MREGLRSTLDDLKRQVAVLHEQDLEFQTAQEKGLQNLDKQLADARQGVLDRSQQQRAAREAWWKEWKRRQAERQADLWSVLVPFEVNDTTKSIIEYVLLHGSIVGWQVQGYRLATGLWDRGSTLWTITSDDGSSFIGRTGSNAGSNGDRSSS